MIAQGFTLDEAKMKRLADAVELLKAKVTEELNITEQAIKYGEAVIALGMDAVLKSKTASPISFPAFKTPKPKNNKGN